MQQIIEIQDSSCILYLRKISPYLAYGREYSSDKNIVFEGYYRHYGLKGWKRISL